MWLAKISLYCMMILGLAWSTFAKEYRLVSPNRRIQVEVFIDAQLRYAVRHAEVELLHPSPIAMTLEGNVHLGKNPRVEKVIRKSVREQIIPIIKQKRAVINDYYEEMTIRCKGNYSIVFRAYDDGVAYRFITRFPKRIKVLDEQSAFSFTADHGIYFPEEPDFFSHQERTYQYIRLSEITPGRQCVTPALVEVTAGPKVLISEADLDDYPGLWLTGDPEDSCTLKGLFPRCALKDSVSSDRDVPVIERADYLAITRGRRSFPWRLLLIAEKDGDLIESDLVFRLGAPLALEDTDWIKPGKVAWDWWNALNVYGVDFRAGINTATYKHYIDFAAQYGLEYIILDEGWYPLGDLLRVVPEIDMPELLRYARAKNVGVILWMSWKTLYDQLQPALDLFAEWGIPGIKVDFMQRDDQWMVNYYRLIAEEAAKRHMLVDFHGAYKPTGMERTFPNVITREGVKGMEHSKWSADVTPEHDLTLIFTRMIAGPMDYTPGAMLNDTERQFKPVYDRPHSQGTRCHQMAMYVVFESPLQMLADSPSNYQRWPDCTRFIADTPTVWDETRVLDA
ncbi:glycoside hydrolase family 97 catalytic domain-containing protein, partial [candidate division KSB1 bacterium]|nr:glycoside hydrolase family 97 catalytic domain-containing protein [candidate division KSB1 bacterium]